VPDAAELEHHRAAQAELDSRITDYLQEVGIKPNEIEPSISARMRELMDRQRLEPDIAHERAVMEADDHAVETENAPERAEYIPGWDVQLLKAKKPHLALAHEQIAKAIEKRLGRSSTSGNANAT
jgi:hypothetical protein